MGAAPRRDARDGTLTFGAGSHRARQLTGADISDESEQALDALIREPRLAPTNAVREAYATHFFCDGARAVEPDNQARRRIPERFAAGVPAMPPPASTSVA